MYLILSTFKHSHQNVKLPILNFTVFAWLLKDWFLAPGWKMSLFHVLDSHSHCSVGDNRDSDAYDAISVTDTSDLDTRFHHSLAVWCGVNRWTCLSQFSHLWRKGYVPCCVLCQLIGKVREVTLNLSTERWRCLDSVRKLWWWWWLYFWMSSLSWLLIPTHFNLTVSYRKGTIFLFYQLGDWDSWKFSFLSHVTHLVSGGVKIGTGSVWF